MSLALIALVPVFTELAMSIARRQLLMHSAALSGAVVALLGTGRQVASAAAPGLDPASLADQTAGLQAAIDGAAAKGEALRLGAGAFHCSTLGLPSGTRISGVPGATRLVFTGGPGFLVASKAHGIILEGLVIDGASQPLDAKTADGLITFAGCKDVTLRALTVTGSLINGISLKQCSGLIAGCSVRDCGQTAIFTIDAQGLAITGNKVGGIGNNGIQVWRSDAGEDGTLVAHNRVSHIEARDGGDGPNGNGINVFRAGSVQVLGNRVSDCAFSAIRANSASNIQIIGNSCERLGEVAIYAEFAFQGAVISDNLVEGASLGISVTNFNEGGRLAVVCGNLLRNLQRKSASGEDLGVGIAIEADTSVTGNVIEAAARVGIHAGWGAYRRDIAITGNVVRASPIGIGLASDEAGGAVLVAQNLISGASAGGIRRMDHADPVGPDLAKDGAGAAAGLTIGGNVSA